MIVIHVLSNWRAMWYDVTKEWHTMIMKMIGPDVMWSKIDVLYDRIRYRVINDLTYHVIGSDITWSRIDIPCKWVSVNEDQLTMWSGQTSGWWLIQWIKMSTVTFSGISTPSRIIGLVSHRLIKGTGLCMRITSFRNMVVYLRRLISSLIKLKSNVRIHTNIHNKK